MPEQVEAGVTMGEGVVTSPEPSQRDKAGPRQRVAAGLVAAGVVNLAALSAAWSFDRLPWLVDSLFALGLPLLLAILVQAWSHRGVTAAQRYARAKLLPGLVIGILPATLASIYPGIFAYRELLHLALDGQALDVSPWEPERFSSAGWISFHDAAVLGDRAGTHTWVVSGGHKQSSKVSRRTCAVAPIVGAGWRVDQPVTAWAVSDPAEPYAFEQAGLQGMRVYDRRGRYRKAVEDAVGRHGLSVDGGLTLVALGGTREARLSHASTRTLAVLAVLSLAAMIAGHRFAPGVPGRRRGSS